MSAGEPNWSRLQALGKLPKDKIGKVPNLAEIERLKKQIAILEDGMCDSCKKRLGIAVDDVKKTEVKKAAAVTTDASADVKKNDQDKK